MKNERPINKMNQSDKETQHLMPVISTFRKVSQHEINLTFRSKGAEFQTW